MLRDLIASVRRLRRHRQGVAPAVLALTLGVGATAAIFTVLQTVLLRPLPGIRDASRLVLVSARKRAYDEVWGGVSPEVESEIRSRVQALASLAAFHVVMATWASRGGARLLYEARVGSAFFQVLGTHPLVGRMLERSDFVPGGGTAVVISHRQWESEFGARPDIIGQAMVLDRRTYQVVGVAPRGFAYPVVSDPGISVWVPLPPAPPSAGFSPAASVRAVVARLRPGVPASAADAQLAALNAELRAEHPDPWQVWELKAEPFSLMVYGQVRDALWLLAASASLLLLIGIVNACSVLLARQLRRMPELALRAALGATRSRIARTVLAEGGVLAAGGGILGIALAWSIVPVLRSLAPPGALRTLGLAPNGWTLGAGCLVAIVAGALVGLYPAWRLSRSEPSRLLSLGVGTGRIAPRRGPLKALLVAEVCLAVLLSAGAALLQESFVRLVGSPTGYRRHGVLTFRLVLPSGYGIAKRENLLNAALASLGATPGVEEAAATNFPLLAKLPPMGTPAVVDGQQIRARNRSVSPGYFSAMGIVVARGRPILPRDGTGRPPVAVVDRRFAQLAWGKADPLGKTLDVGTPAHPYVLQVAGVAADARDNGLAASPLPEIYGALAQTGFTNLVFALRTRPGRVPTVASLRAAMASLEPQAAVADVRTLADLVNADVAVARFRTRLVEALAALGLLLCSVGVYGVFSGWVVDRRAEIGIRLALGASPKGIRRMILREGLTLAFVGIGAGVGLACVAGRAIQHFMYETSYVDPRALAGACILTLGVTLCAVFVPAQRALRVDPAVALRNQ